MMKWVLEKSSAVLTLLLLSHLETQTADPHVKSSDSSQQRKI